MNLNVLVADDERAVLSLIRHTLKRFPYEVETVASGREAMASIRRRPPDILVTDIHMPGMTGMALLKAALDIHPDLLAIAITGYGDVAMAVEFMKSGGIDFLQKPVNRDVLLLAIESAANRWRLRDELRRSERALAASEKRYRRIFDGAPVGIFQCDLSGRFLRVNPTLARMFGYDDSQAMIEAENIGQGGFCRHSDGWADAVARSREAPVMGRWIHARIEGVARDNRRIVLQNTLRTVRDRTDAPRHIEGFVEDITEAARRQAAFRREMERAKDLYDLVASPALPLMPGLAVDAACMPAERIGGDLLDFFRIDDRRLLIFLADVTGHGIPAAMTANTLKTLFRAVAGDDPDPAVVCRRLNRLIHDFILPDDLIAVFCGLLDMSAMTLTYYLSGLPAPLIVRDGEALPLAPTGLPFGVFEEVECRCDQTPLRIGDSILAVTDGITEATDPAGDVFGGARFREGAIRLSRSGALTADAVAAEAARFRGTPGFADDVIVMVLSVFDPDASPKQAVRTVHDRFQGPDKCRFRLRARAIRVDAAAAFIMDHVRERVGGEDPDAFDALKLAFTEVFVNAVEHGALEMTDLKRNSDLYDSDRYWAIFAERSGQRPYADRCIDVECRFEEGRDAAVSITVVGEGPGFNPAQAPDPRLAANRTRHSGRGIALARMNVDHLFYSPDGRQATLVKTWRGGCGSPPVAIV